MDAEANGSVQVLGIGHLAAAVRMHLQAACSTSTEPEAPDSIQPLVVACSDFPNTDSFRDANARSLAAGARILFVAMAMPRVVLIGPLVAPGRAGCFECVRPRVLVVSNVGGEADPVRYAQIGAGLAVREILASRLTPYKGTPGPERRTGRRWARCPACRARA
jgi:hypothetical protein